jgi:acetylornithine deacetylase/succinyl-diaminopimelate desuccinylase-like protein
VTILKEVYQLIDRESDQFIEEFREFVQIPGISTENTGIEESVEWLVAAMKKNGVSDVQVFETPRHPIILGRVDTAAKRTLLVYGHYDVQPPGNRQDWKVNPFSAEIIDTRIVGRGTCDMKNNLMASLQAVKAFIECRNSVPINLVFLFEGEEETGSPSLKPFIETHKTDLLHCDSILCAEGGENKAGQVQVTYGLKGLLYVELTTKSPNRVEVHSMYAGITENPAWGLIEALQSLKQGDRILIPEFYQHIKAPSDEELMKLGIIDSRIDRNGLENAFELQIKKEMDVSTALFEAFYKPTLNIDGLWSGYTIKKGIKTIIPATAGAKIDMRLVPEQDPTTIYRNLKEYLAKQGFTNVETEVLGELPAYRVHPDERLVDVVTQALTTVVSRRVMIMPMMLGSGAMAWLPHILEKPMAFAGSGPFYMAHRPNEFISIPQYVKGIKLFATIYSRFALP